MPKQFLDEEGLAIVATKVNEKLKVVDAMPSTPTSGQVVLYVGATTTDYTQGGIYLYSGTAWVLISTADVDLTPYKKIFTGTKAEWDVLTTAEKTEFDECDLTDDLAGGELLVSDAVTVGDLNPVTSNAVANHIPNMTRALVAWPTESAPIAWGNHKGVIIQTGNSVGTSVTSQVLVMRNFPNAYVGNLFYPAANNDILTANVIKTAEGFYLSPRPSEWTNGTVILYWID